MTSIACVCVWYTKCDLTANINHSQVFPQDLLPSTHPDPGSPGRVLGRSEVERRERYFTELQQQLGEGHPLEGLIKECLDNSPSRRPTAEQLLSRLEEVGPVVRGPQDHTHKLQLMKQLRDIEVIQTYLFVLYSIRG